MSILEIVELSQIFPLSRPPGRERVPDRAGEGSLSAKVMLLKCFSPSKKEPSPGLRPPSPIASRRERGKPIESEPTHQFSPESPAACGRRARRADEGILAPFADGPEGQYSKPLRASFA